MRHHKHRHHRHHRRRPQYGPRRPKHNVPVNIEEFSTHFEARVFCVGFKREDIKISLANDVIYISGHRHPEHDTPDFLLQEYPIKSFERWFQLSEKVDQEAITAKMDEGVLVITAPKAGANMKPDREVTIE
ncbi:Hsp20/alpha crystallin family protein [Lewinella sp. W8]|uniref:Hsp20/alpha crystallin family protein n=1 Tax=Lewinella sp. W8 TaxID=2528208 RepID=UPI001067EC59|nr:Hsp20/alpha crystallin family protein [Lewinella sp. W8]MTB50521.1 Hsp20 family protein [Lewinella sp. W8]